MKIVFFLSFLCASTAWIVKQIFNAEQSCPEDIALAKTTDYYQTYRKIFFLSIVAVWCMGIAIFIFTANKGAWIVILTLFLCAALTFILYAVFDRVFKNKALFIARNGTRGLPLCVYSGMLLINRTFMCERIPLEKILWIHSYRVIDFYATPATIACFRLDNGGAIRLLINPSHAKRVNAFIDNLKEDRPTLLVSHGFFNAEYKGCKNAYKTMVKLKLP
ncbi:MAG: hypothetical protein LBE89_06740 [Helicobacteraceae bacterium]|jgi:hypothetical protein|nr:hypothetical protein [Helicobacteraceae bacterium]